MIFPPLTEEQRKFCERLYELISNAPPMTKADHEAQRKSWVRGQMMLSNPEMTMYEFEAAWQRVEGDDLRDARISELRAENDRMRNILRDAHFAICAADWPWLVDRITSVLTGGAEG